VGTFRPSCRRRLKRGTSAGGLGLEPAPGRLAGHSARPFTPSCLSGDRQLPGASLEKFRAQKCGGCKKTEIGRGRRAVRQGGQKGLVVGCRTSVNPIGAEQIVGPGAACLRWQTRHAALENIALWQRTRTFSHSFGRGAVILPDSCIALDHMLRRMTRIVRRDGWSTPERHAREPEPLARASLFFPHGTTRAREKRENRAREQAYEWVQAQRDANPLPSTRDFQNAAARPNPEVTGALPAAEIEARVSTLDGQLKARRPTFSESRFFIR